MGEYSTCKTEQAIYVWAGVKIKGSGWRELTEKPSWRRWGSYGLWVYRVWDIGSNHLVPANLSTQSLGEGQLWVPSPAGVSLRCGPGHLMTLVQLSAQNILGAPPRPIVLLCPSASLILLPPPPPPPQIPFFLAYQGLCSVYCFLSSCKLCFYCSSHMATPPTYA